MPNQESKSKPAEAEQESGKGLDETACYALRCKDIPDLPILELLAKNPTQWHNWCWTEWNVTEAMPPGIPPKLALAKMRRMIRRGVVGGCPCGCRGDFVITEKGLAEISSHNARGDTRRDEAGNHE
jgi:hypothetical protein